MNKPTGTGRGTAQYFEGKSEWAVSVSDNYTHFRNHDEGYTETIYHFLTKPSSGQTMNCPH